jgi:hypothetical protein
MNTSTLQKNIKIKQVLIFPLIARSEFLDQSKYRKILFELKKEKN